MRVDAALGSAGGSEALAVIDVDHFKQVNDRFGHPFGDRYLTLIASSLLEGLGANPIVGRIGGDEFAALLEPGSREDHLAAVERVLSAIRAAVAEIGQPGLGQLSTGLCRISDAPEPAFEALYQRADVALYAAKDRGRNRMCVFSEELDGLYNLGAQRARFSDALAAGRIVPFLQPKIDLASGLTAGFELLARWRDPRRGLLSPARGAVEECGHRAGRALPGD